MTLIKVITLEDHFLTREGITSILAKSQDIELVGEGSAGEHLEPLVINHRPDIVLLDLNLPQKENGTVRIAGNSFRAIPAIRWLTKYHPNTKVIIISQYISPAFVEGALEAGIRGYLLKDDVMTQYLPEAIRAVYKGGHYFSEEVSAQLRNSQSAAELLTKRQREIIRAVAADPESPFATHASRLGISIHTLSNHRRQLFERLGFNNMTAAVVKAIQLGIVSVAFVDALQQENDGDSAHI